MSDIVTTDVSTTAATPAAFDAPVNRQGHEQDVKPAPFGEVGFGSEDEAEARIAAAIAGEAWDGGAGARGNTQAVTAQDGGAPAPGATEAGTEGQATEKAIEAPAHWPADQAAAWANLPRSVQEAIATPPAAAPVDLNAHPEVQTELTQFRTQRQQQHEAVTALIGVLRQQFQGDELGKMSQADWDNLATSDPARFVQLQHTMNQRVGLMQQAMHAQQQLAAQAQADQEQQLQAHIGQQRALMEKHHPDFVGDKGKAARAEARDYLVSAGFTADEVAQLQDYRLIGVVKDAIRGRAAAKAADIAAKKVASAPPVARPTASAGSNPGLDKANAINAMRNATSTDDQVAILSRFM